MNDPARRMMRTHLDEPQLARFPSELLSWLVGRVSLGESAAEAYPENRARAVLRAANAIDPSALRQFAQNVSLEASGSGASIRLALYDLLSESGLAENEEVLALVAARGFQKADHSTEFTSWLALTLAVYAWRNGFPIDQLEPSAPPDPFSPAGQLVAQAASFIRRQVQRTATERDRAVRSLGYQGGASASGSPTLEEMQTGDPVAPIPPHYRPPVPVTYPEVSNEVLTIGANEGSTDMPAAPQPEISIADVELPPQETARRMPPIRITADQVASSSHTPSAVVTPSPSPAPAASFARAVRHRFRRERETFGTTKLRVVVQDHQDGPALHGLQVRVKCTGVRSFVAGTTNREGTFVCELPVRMRSGLTYDVEVTWPRDLGGEIETKSITLNADRTAFKLPFYRRYQ